MTYYYMAHVCIWHAHVMIVCASFIKSYTIVTAHVVLVSQFKGRVTYKIKKIFFSFIEMFE